MKLRCPCCHASNSLEAYTADESGRELLVLLAGSGSLFKPLVAYLGCFRPASRDLSHARDLKLAREVLELPADRSALAKALTETVEAMRAKRDQGDVRPLKNHNYLKRVVESVDAGGHAVTEYVANDNPAPRGKRASAIVALSEWAGSGWLERGLAEGLSALLTLGLDGTPAADVICRTADIWRLVAQRQGLKIEEIDAPRIRKGFEKLLSQGLKRWPEPAALIEALPRRPERPKLDEPPLSAAEREAGKQRLRELREQLARKGE